MKPLLFAMPGNEEFTHLLTSILGADLGLLETRTFPDGETYMRFGSDVQGRSIVLVCTLDRPNAKTLPLLFAANAARDLGASHVGLVAPYLGYMRQDKRFHPGEAITSSSYGRFLSSAFDWIATVDPHLHRRASMSEIYSNPVGVCHAAPKLSEWIRNHVSTALVVGPDAESEQWVSVVAADAGVPYVTLEKTRRGDRDVDITFPDIEQWRGKTPVLVDDIISSGRTMEVAVRCLLSLGFIAPVCLGVHGVFAEDAYERLMTAGASEIVSTNTVPHTSNGIDISGAVAKAMSEFLQ
ncbi:ribose-phosphate pyrophosphokinase [Hyphomicrobium sp. 2TAF46]|uniref:ribose-phosphate pyrophosphokinase n=1 Tax=Hyphomicrobium sp. 2TAF46 TaxID=3233019 RepID=UPI003F9293E6